MASRSEIKLAKKAIDSRFRSVLSKNAINESLPKEARAIMRNYGITGMAKRVATAPFRFLRMTR